MYLSKTKNIIIIFFICGIFFGACNLFSTRNPENPDTERTKNLPPTSPQIVVSNFLNSIIEKNSENYKACFSDTSLTSGSEYRFSASAEAFVRYNELFKNWGILYEHRYFVSLVSNIPDDSSPEIILTNDRFKILLPDSAVYLADYYLNVNHKVLSIPKEYSGALQFTIIPSSNGMWSIQNWFDISLPIDTTGNTWSILKARFVN